MVPPAYIYPKGIDYNRRFTFASVTSPTMCLFTLLPHHTVIRPFETHSHTHIRQRKEKPKRIVSVKITNSSMTLP